MADFDSTPTSLPYEKLGLVAVMAIAVWAFVKGKVVPEWIYTKERERGDKWEAAAQKLQEQLSILTRITQKTIAEIEDNTPEDK